MWLLPVLAGERYPDPVRVVSIGPTIPQLLADPGNAEWEQYSIELCGGTHIPTTDVMADFALVEETAVAKGVRRVLGVTGKAARAALDMGTSLSERLAALRAVDPSALSDASEMDTLRKQLTAFKLELDEATMSAHTKAGLREQLGATEKALTAVAKKRAQAATDGAATAAVALAQEAAAAGDKYVVIDLGEGFTAKAMQPLVKQVLKQTKLPVMVLSADKDAGKVACMAAVPDDRTEALPADGWLQAALREVGGRGGGKAGSAQGSGTDLANMPSAIDAAKEFASGKL